MLEGPTRMAMLDSPTGTTEVWEYHGYICPGCRTSYDNRVMAEACADHHLTGIPLHEIGMTLRVMRYEGGGESQAVWYDGTVVQKDGSANKFKPRVLVETRYNERWWATLVGGEWYVK